MVLIHVVIKSTTACLSVLGVIKPTSGIFFDRVPQIMTGTMTTPKENAKMEEIILVIVF